MSLRGVRSVLCLPFLPVRLRPGGACWVVGFPWLFFVVCLSGVAGPFCVFLFSRSGGFRVCFFFGFFGFFLVLGLLFPGLPAILLV